MGKRHLYIFLLSALIWSVILAPRGAGAITIQEEEDMSKEFLKVVAEHYSILKDPIISEYIESVGKKITATLPPQPFSFHFYVIREDVYNAFATPAGHIFLNSGLLMAMESESELAGILAHEIAHVVCRHISGKIERGKKLQMATLAGMVAGIFLGVSGNSEAAQAVTTGSVAAGHSATLAYSREDERQADQLGLRYMLAAGYDAGGLVKTLERIRSKQWFGSSQIPTYLSTHPGVEERIATVSAWNDRNVNENGDPKSSSDAFARTHARLLALYGDKDRVKKQLDDALEQHPESPWALYGKGLFLSRSGKSADAIALLKSALEKRAFDPVLLSDLGGLYFQAGMLEDAATSLQGALSIRQDLPEALLLLGRTQMEMGHSQAAAESLERLTRLKVNVPDAHYYLAQAYGNLGRTAQAHYHLAVHYQDKREIDTALFHLKRARDAWDGTDAALRREMDDLMDQLMKSRKERKQQEGQ